MPSYVIVEISIHDYKQFEEYKKLKPAAIADLMESSLSGVGI